VEDFGFEAVSRGGSGIERKLHARGEPMNVLTVNSGSSSVRLAAFAQVPALTKLADRHHGGIDGVPETQLREFVDAHGLDEVTAIAHRVVHGGARLTRACRIDAAVEAEIAGLAVLAPLHNPKALRWVAACRHVLGDRVPQIAVFDTAFYAGLPAAAAAYALPRDLCARHGIRRYGFHGLAHQALWRRWCALAPPTARAGGRVISLQLGAGASITATEGGAAVDTSMGFSPLEGLMMATRAGDVDAGLVTFLQRHERLSPEATEDLLNRRSGLLGVAGEADMKRLLARNDVDARLAIDMYCRRARKYVGAYLALLGGADAILFGGGVGEHAPSIRAQILANLAWAGIALDDKANLSTTGEARISRPGSPTQIWVLPVDEAAILAEEALRVLDGEEEAKR
jgi:acetate kinase